MKWPMLGAFACTTVMMVSGCSSTHMNDIDLEQRGAYLKPVQQEVDPVAPMTLRVVGYGAPSTDSSQTAVQRRLLAMRASKMDAYRSMAERVYGTSVSGTTTVRDMVLQNDRFRTYVETYMHGARVVSTDVMPDGSVETILEMTIDQGFRNCLQTSDNQRFNVDCRASLTAGGPSPMMSGQRQRVQNEAAAPNNGFYFIE